MGDFYPGIEDSEVFVHVRRLMTDGGIQRLESELRLADGSSHWFELCLMRVAEGVAILSLDVTEKKRAVLGAKRVQRMEAVGQLAGGVAHDFNNLLTLIQTSASFLKQDLPSDGPAQADVDTILSAVATASQLTHKLLAFARQMPVAARAFSVKEAVESAVLLLRRAVGSTVVLETKISDDAGSVFVDPSALDQILINLAVNARDAMPKGGTLTISARSIQLDAEWVRAHGFALEPGAYAEISARDTGTGIPADVIDHIFEPFFTTKSEDRGTGLGLASCWGLVTQSGGTITVDSELGRGTVFRLYLPTSEPKSPEARKKGTFPPVQAPVASVLVVEDRPEFSTLIGRVLRPQGYRIIEAADSEEALHILTRSQSQVDLLLCDAASPGSTGPDLASRVRNAHPGVRLLLMSDLCEAEPRARTSDVSSPEVLHKPFTPGHLIGAVERALSVGRTLSVERTSDAPREEL
jgi:signal transduction histidine kinase/ActR/RegA family two-component response regulator